MSAGQNSKLIWGLVIILAVVHWDFWFWSDQTLLFGFLPIGLGYHALFSLAAAGVWTLALKLIWPSNLEEWAAQGEDEA